MEVVRMPHISAVTVLAELHQRELLAEAERYRRHRAPRAPGRRWWDGWLRAWQQRGSLPATGSTRAVTPCL